MSIHYKFKSALDFDTVTFDGLHISVGDLKKAIIHQKRLGKVTDFDLQITNAQTKEEYEDDSCLIPKNTSLVIARIPLTHQPKKTWSTQPENSLQVRSVSKAESTSLDLSKMKGTEEEKIQAMMLQSTADYDPKSYHRIRGQSQTGEVPATYRCNKCKKGGHWIKNCTVVIGKEHMDIKRNTGIPKSFRDKDEKALEAEKTEPISIGEKTQEIPDDLLCSICNDLFVDAVMIPCCGSSFCDDCVRTALLESEDNECPDCKEKGSSPGSLIPNRFLRNSVNAFRNETGYNANHLQKVLRCNKPTENVEDKQQTVSSTEEVLSKPLSKAIEEDITGQTNLSEESSMELESNKNSHRKAETPSCEDIDSDFEDNITVMMPPARIKSPHAVFRERPYNGRSSRHPKPPGIESSPRNHLQVSPLRSYRDNKHRSPMETNNIEWERECDRERDYHEQSANLKTLCQSNLIPHYSSCKSQVRPVRPMNSHDVFSGPPNRINTYPQVPTHPQIIQVPSVQGPSMGSFDNMYNQIGPRTNLGYSHCIRPMFHNTSSGYLTMRGHPTDPIQPLHTNNLASVYQGVAAKVGTGIIDDPLEAFNRLMKEKEKRKEERRRSQEHRRSRSIERQQTSRFRSSPYDRKTEKKDKEKLPRMRDQRLKHGFEKRHEKDKSFSHRYSQSFSDRSSRSRSWSKSPHKKLSKSPIHNRRSRSRTHTIGEKNRHMEKRYSLRREDDFRYQSPVTNLRRSRSRERPHTIYHTNWYPPHVSSTHTTNKFKRENIRSPPYKRSMTPQLKRDQQNSLVTLKRIEGSPLEILEPPPPGFEGNPSQECNNWNILQQEPPNKLRQRRRTPDLYEKCVSQDVEEKNVYGPHSNFNRSNAKYANHTSEKNKRHARSRTPTSKPPAKNAEKLKETINRRPRKSAERRKRENVINDIERNAKQNKEQKRDRSKEQENIEDAINESEISKQEEENMKYVITEKCENQLSGKGIDRTLKNIELEKEKTKKPCLMDEEKSEKKLKYRKKKRKEKSERKKVKKDKKEKRERDKEKNTSEQLQNDETETIKTPDLNMNMTAMEEHRKLQIENENVPAIKWNPETKYVCKEPIEDGELVDGSNNGTNNVINQLPTKTKNEATIESEIKRVDSILDIHGYETDFDETNSLDQRNKTILVAPEPSKWERDEQISVGVPVINHYHENICFTEESREKVTNEVLRKAENAIFARAINAIRPIEVKNTSTEYQETRSTSPQTSAIFQNNAKENMKSFKITVPLSNSQERSVEIKGDGKNKSGSPKVTKSVKDRLGSKIVNKRDFSRHNDMQNNRGANRSRSRDRHPSLNKTCETHKERLDDHRARYRDRARNRDREGFNKRFEEYKPSRTSFNSMVDRRHGDDGARKLNSDHLSNRSIKSSKNYKSENNNDRAGSKHDEKSGIYRKNEETLRSELKQKKSKEHGKSEDKPEVSNFKNEEKVKNPFSKNENTDGLRCLDRNYEIKRQSIITDAESNSESLNSDSDSEDHKRRKRHKYKKDKKRIKRSSSTESVASAKKKHIKSKKRNKSAKKKKKNKK